MENNGTNGTTNGNGTTEKKGGLDHATKSALGKLIAQAKREAGGSEDKLHEAIAALCEGRPTEEVAYIRFKTDPSGSAEEQEKVRRPLGLTRREPPPKLEGDTENNLFLREIASLRDRRDGHFRYGASIVGPQHYKRRFWCWADEMKYIVGRKAEILADVAKLVEMVKTAMVKSGKLKAGQELPAEVIAKIQARVQSESLVARIFAMREDADMVLKGGASAFQALQTCGVSTLAHHKVAWEGPTIRESSVITAAEAAERSGYLLVDMETLCELMVVYRTKGAKRQLERAEGKVQRHVELEAAQQVTLEEGHRRKVLGEGVVDVSDPAKAAQQRQEQIASRMSIASRVIGGGGETKTRLADLLKSVQVVKPAPTNPTGSGNP